MIWFSGKPGNCFAATALCAAEVRTQARSGGTCASMRSKVDWSSVRSPVRARNCLGRALRLRGQKRVPPPPAMIKA